MLLRKGLITMGLIAGMIGFDGTLVAQSTPSSGGASAAQGDAATIDDGDVELHRYGYHGDVVWSDGSGTSITLDTATGIFDFVLVNGSVGAGLLTLSKSGSQLTADVQVAGGPRVHVPIFPGDDGNGLLRYSDLVDAIMVAIDAMEAAQGGAVQPN